MDIYNKVRDVILDVVTKRYNNLDIKTLNLITCEQPKNLKFGDLSTNVLMILKNKFSEDLNEIKNLITDDLEAISMFERVTYVKPGFINFILKKNIWYEVISNINRTNNYGFKNIGLNKRVNLEFISANPTGPLHVGHLRGAVFGDVLSRLMTKTGFKVTKEYYVNDLGNQIENLFQTVKIHIENKVNNTNKALKEGMYLGDYLKEIALQLTKENFNLSNTKQAKENIVKKILDLIKEDLKKLGIVFDSFISEKAIHEQGLLDQALVFLNKKNLIYEGTLEAPKGKKSINWKPEKQLIFKSSSFGDSVDRAIKKNNGEWTYFASDIAYHYNKIERGFEEIINIWGADHAGYIKRVEASIKALTNKQIKFDVKLCQIVNLLENNKSVKMSKRAGNFILINDILKKIDKDVVRFFMLIRKNDAHLDFDMKKCLYESKENPIFYIQYAVARINSLNKFFKEKQLKLLDFNQKLFDRFDENEIALLKALSLWPKVIENSVIYKEPHRIVYYLIDLAGAFHNYWSKGNLDSKMRVINEADIELTVARLTLLNCISKVIKLGLDILAIKPVEKM
tara:strand:+ start:642 stop:2345 length:1704 start_codon:yes stop_codon:yes gene_type:complete